MIIPGLVDKKVRDVTVKMAILYVGRETVLSAVCSYFNLTLHDIVKRDRRREKVFIRQMLCWLLRKRTSMTLVEIGTLVGGRDHTTAIHSAKTFQDTIDTEPEAAEHLQHVMLLIDQIKENKAA
jgi:chromosomal replication initiator protein